MRKTLIQAAGTQPANPPKRVPLRIDAALMLRPVPRNDDFTLRLESELKKIRSELVALQKWIKALGKRRDARLSNLLKMTIQKRPAVHRGVPKTKEPGTIAQPND